MPALHDVIDAAVELNLVPSEYFAFFDELGQWQLDALRASGLQPHHELLDVGCGAMRLGMKAVPFLEHGFYAGVDAFTPYIELGNRLAVADSLPPRYKLICADDFPFKAFGRQFDFAIAQSVFTHLSEPAVRRCCLKVSECMKPGGVFLFTFLLGVPRTQGFLYGANQPMRRLAITSDALFHEIAGDLGARYELTTIKHATQHVGVLRF